MELTHSQTASAVPSHKNTLRPAAFRNIRGGSGSIFKETGIMSSLTPRQIVAELDKYIIGQEQAKRMVAVAVRNRWRRQQLAPELRDEIAPKNIILMGPTGVGKTEIARRLARLTGAPFIKVEATKYTDCWICCCPAAAMNPPAKSCASSGAWATLTTARWKWR